MTMAIVMHGKIGRAKTGFMHAMVNENRLARPNSRRWLRRTAIRMQIAIGEVAEVAPLGP